MRGPDAIYPEVTVQVSYKSLLGYAEKLRLCSRKEMLYYLMLDELVPDIGKEIEIWPLYEKSLLQYHTFIVLNYVARVILEKPNFRIVNI